MFHVTLPNFGSSLGSYATLGDAVAAAEKCGFDASVWAGGALVASRTAWSGTVTFYGKGA